MSFVVKPIGHLETYSGVNFTVLILAPALKMEEYRLLTDSMTDYLSILPYYARECRTLARVDAY